MDVTSSDPTERRGHADGYMPIENYGLIGNMRTCAMVATDGAVDFMCWPHFDSPSVFARLLDRRKGGHFTIAPKCFNTRVTTKQQYLPSSNVLQTRFLDDDGVLNLIDFFPRPLNPMAPSKIGATGTARSLTPTPILADPLKKWLVRRVECIRGEVEVEMNILPAFNYARDAHRTSVVACKCAECRDGDKRNYETAVFTSKTLNLQLEATIDCGENTEECPRVHLVCVEGSELGDGITTQFKLKEGQAVSFVLREAAAPGNSHEEHLTTALVDHVQRDTQGFWFKWISQSIYKGRWREVVSRSLLILKLLTFEPTGAIVAAPTFSLPEDFGGSRNWDYRYCWVRDSSFTIYILLRMGFRSEAEAYMNFISDRFSHSRTPEGALPIMFSIHGSTELPELELTHLDGYKSSKPVRIGNGAAFHKQFDIYGELIDGIYLYNKYGKPISYDQWTSVREIVDYVCTIWHEKDMSIWEVRGEIQNFVYSKMMMWVALDRAIRLSEKRSNLPAPQREKWMRVRDEMYEEVMEKGYNKEIGAFIQSYEHKEILDSAVLIAPLVFFVAPNDPRFTRTLELILRPPEKGGLTSTGLVYRYNWMKSDDGVGGREGAFSMCTFWLVEALTRAGEYEKDYLVRAINTFENILGFSNHLNMFSEEISQTGEQLGNTPQAFSHLSLISAAFNLDRATAGTGGI
jgi:GH15 family glucan-1,4-alpha-glucosidase